MPHVPALARALAVTLLVALALTQPSLAVARPAAGKPAVGACYDYTAQQLRKPTQSRAAVPCTSAHTAQSVAVLRVTGSPSAADVFERYGPRCYRAMTRALGGNPSRIVSTAYDLAFFRPTRKQIRQGAHWLRCDVVLTGGNRLQPLASPLVTDPSSDDVARCANGKALRPTVCSRPHDYRATGTVTANRSYPGESGFAEIAFDRCPAKVSTAKRYFLYFPRGEQWRSGFHAMACLSRTSG